MEVIVVLLFFDDAFQVQDDDNVRFLRIVVVELEVVLLIPTGFGFRCGDE
jgi:hypothetical protein